MPDWAWWQYIVGIVVVVMSLVAIKVVATFNVTDWLKHRDERRLDRLRALCPHTEIEVLPDGKLKVESLIGKPPLTYEWSCYRCGLRVPGGESQAWQITDAWGKDPLGWMKRTKRFTKLAKRLGYL